MSETAIILLPSIFLLLVALGLGLVRVLIGPSVQDRMLAVQLLGTGGVAILLLIATLLQTTALIDVALLLALLAIVAVAALTRKDPDDA